MTKIARNIKAAGRSAAKATKIATTKTVAAGRKAARAVGNAVIATGRKIKRAAK